MFVRQFPNFKGKWQEKFLSSYLKETPKQYKKCITQFLYLPYLVRYFDLKSLVVRHLGYLQIFEF